MIRRILKYLGWMIAAGILFVTIVLGEAHWQIRRFDAPLPDDAAIATLLTASDGPIDVRLINTATQNIRATGVIAYPAFALRWSDGRIMVIDTGMARDGAKAFGEFLENVAGADPIEIHGSVGDQLGAAARDIAAIVFTHLHDDHTGGLASLCGDQASLIAFQSRQQATETNFTTSNGSGQLKNSACVRSEILNDNEGLMPVPGFPGVALYAAGGHTPGTTVIFAAVDSSLWIFSGDVTNTKAGIDTNTPKPFLYRLVVVPEDDERLQVLRVWLAKLDSMSRYTVLVSHDLNSLSTSGIRSWPDSAN